MVCREGCRGRGDRQMTDENFQREVEEYLAEQPEHRETIEALFEIEETLGSEAMEIAAMQHIAKAAETDPEAYEWLEQRSRHGHRLGRGMMCPRCSSPMIVRRKRNAREAFLGCTRYP